MPKPLEEQKIRPNRLSLEAAKIGPREGLVVDREEEAGAQSSVRGVRRGRGAAEQRGQIATAIDAWRRRRRRAEVRKPMGSETDSG